MSEQVDAVTIAHAVDPDLRRRKIAELGQVPPDGIICFLYAAPDNTAEPVADIAINAPRLWPVLKSLINQPSPRLDCVECGALKSPNPQPAGDL